MSTRIPKPSVTMRKEPRQARSRATVGAIVQAGAQVLGDRGWSGFTTNEVADVAGVSIGSLYQYFPNKLALTDAIRHKHWENVLAVLRQTGKSRSSPEQLVDDLVQGVISVHCINPALHRVLLDLPNREGSKSAADEFQSEYLRLYSIVIAAYRNRQGSAADGVAAQVLSSAIEGVVHNAARRGMLKSPELKRELTILVYGYLGRATLSSSL
jgi:AcrR family transcriptional regulator